MRLPDDCPIYKERAEFTTYTDEGGLPLVFKWFHIDELNLIRLLPVFLTAKLASLAPSTEYLVNYEGSQSLDDGDEPL
jgi:hypothetical protein